MNVSIGDRKMQKYDLCATVVEIVGDNKCRIRFDNGVEKEVSFLTFKRGLSSGLTVDKIPKVEGANKHHYKVGDRVLQNCGVYAELIKLLPNGRCVVKFDNGVIVDTLRYSFKIGNVACQSRVDFFKEKYVGMRVKAKNGVWLTLTEYNNSSNVTVKSEDGKISNVSFAFFKKGSSSLTNSYHKNMSKLEKGTKVKQRNGLYAEYIGSDGKGKLIVKFSNGVVREGVPKKHFLNGMLNADSNGSSSTLTGKTFTNSLGMRYTIVKRVTLNNKGKRYLLKWENGLESEATLVGKFGNPTPSEMTNAGGVVKYNKDKSKVLFSYYDAELNKYVLIVENKDKVRKIILL